jgi:hypothetical protein
MQNQAAPKRSGGGSRRELLLPPPHCDRAGFEPCVRGAGPACRRHQRSKCAVKWYIHGAAQIRRGKNAGQKPSTTRRDFRPTFDLPALPSHKTHSIRRNFDPSVHLLLLQQIKNWLFEHDWLVRFREIQKKTEFLLVIGS